MHSYACTSGVGCVGRNRPPTQQPAVSPAARPRDSRCAWAGALDCEPATRRPGIVRRGAPVAAGQDEGEDRRNRRSQGGPTVTPTVTPIVLTTVSSTVILLHRHGHITHRASVVSSLLLHRTIPSSLLHRHCYADRYTSRYIVIVPSQARLDALQGTKRQRDQLRHRVTAAALEPSRPTGRRGRPASRPQGLGGGGVGRWL